MRLAVSGQSLISESGFYSSAADSSLPLIGGILRGTVAVIRTASAPAVVACRLHASRDRQAPRVDGPPVTGIYCEMTGTRFADTRHPSSGVTIPVKASKSDIGHASLPGIAVTNIDNHSMYLVPSDIGVCYLAHGATDRIQCNVQQAC